MTSVAGTHAWYCTFRVADQDFGLPVGAVREVMRDQRTTSVPAGDEVLAGLLNLRGDIITCVDLRRRLEFAPAGDAELRAMHVIVEVDGEMTSLRVDAVGEVVELPTDGFELPPSTVRSSIRAVVSGVCRRPAGLLQLLDERALLADARAE